MSVKAYREETHFQVEFEGRLYDVVRSRGSYNGWQEQWTVHGFGSNQRRYCDPTGRTYKRVLAYVKAGILGDAVPFVGVPS